jgi:hypothetical protein
MPGDDYRGWLKLNCSHPSALILVERLLDDVGKCEPEPRRARTRRPGHCDVPLSVQCADEAAALPYASHALATTQSLTKSSKPAGGQRSRCMQDDLEAEQVGVLTVGKLRLAGQWRKISGWATREKLAGRTGACYSVNLIFHEILGWATAAGVPTCEILGWATAAGVPT